VGLLLGGWIVRLFTRFLQRLMILGLGIISVRLIVFVFRFVDDRRSWILASLCRYFSSRVIA
jgi:hypothetical protein